MDIVELMQKALDKTNDPDAIFALDKGITEIERLREGLKNPVCDCPYLDDLIKKDDEIDRLRETLRLIAEHPVEQSGQWEVGAKEMQKLARAALKEGE